MKEGSSPRIVTSSRQIKYRRSEWKVEEFEVWSGGAVCSAVALRVAGSTLVWVGAGGGVAPRLVEAALAVPAGEEGPRAALVTPLLGAGESAVPLARRLAAALRRPVYVCAGAAFDRFTLPLVERALLSQIKARPEGQCV